MRLLHLYMQHQNTHSSNTKTSSLKFYQRIEVKHTRAFESCKTHYHNIYVRSMAADKELFHYAYNSK
jgi:hypothetical protein